MEVGKEEIILSYPKLDKWITSRRDPAGGRRRSLALLRELASDFSPWRMGLCERILDTTLPHLYRELDFQENGLDLAKLVKTASVIFVPNHQSHADYVTLNYLIYKKYRTPVSIAGGINLNIFLIGNLFRGSGCFFIRRTFASNVLYKLTLEAYLYYLLKSHRPVEFFFEGGRSRTGRFLPPKHGLYRMFLDAHAQLAEEEDRELLFIPVSINHEHIPEQGSLARELAGEKKKAEHVGQLPGLLKLFVRRFGTVHLRLGDPIPFVPDQKISKKEQVVHLASQCFDQVAEFSLITPSSLLSLVLLDFPPNILERTWKEILERAKKIVSYARTMDFPLAPSLEPDTLVSALAETMDIMVGHGNVAVKPLAGPTPPRYIPTGRMELCYLKNTIFHHFLGATLGARLLRKDQWEEDFLTQRVRLEKEFTLPSTFDLERETFWALSYWAGQKLEDGKSLQGIPLAQKKVMLRESEPFCHTLRPGQEGLYVCALGLSVLGRLLPRGFTAEEFEEKTRKIFGAQLHRRTHVQLDESYSSLFAHWALGYFENCGLCRREKNLFLLDSPQDLDSLTGDLEKELEVG